MDYWNWNFFRNLYISPEVKGVQVLNFGMIVEGKKPLIEKFLPKKV